MLLTTENFKNNNKAEFTLKIIVFDAEIVAFAINSNSKQIEAFDKAHVAISIVPINASKPIAKYQADNFMTPASNIKLLTFLAAIENFDSLPALYYRDQDSITHFKSTGYPLLLHPLYPDTELLSFLKNKQSLVYHKPKSNLKRQGPSRDGLLKPFLMEDSLHLIRSILY